MVRSRGLALVFAVGFLLSLAVKPAVSQSVASLPVDAESVDGFDANVAPTPGQLLPLDGQGRYPLSTIQACTPGQILKFGTTGWGCSSDGGAAATDLVCAGCVAIGELGFDPATQAELDALGSAGTINASANPVHWTKLKGVPTGIADGVDNDTTYTAGAGLSLSGTTLSVPTAGITSAMTANEAAAKGSSTKSNISIGSGSPTTLATVTANFPSDGFALVTMGASLNATGAGGWLDVTLTEDGTSRFGTYWDPGDTDTWFDQYQSTTTLLAVTAGTKTYTLLARAAVGAPPVAYHRDLTILFVPTSL